MSNQKHVGEGGEPGAQDVRPCYEPPRVILYAEDALLEALGPVKACASFFPFSTNARRPFQEQRYIRALNWMDYMNSDE